MKKRRAQSCSLTVVPMYSLKAFTEMAPYRTRFFPRDPFEYPGDKSRAPRGHCERCIERPDPTARGLRLLRQRVEQLARPVETWSAGDPAEEDTA